MSFSRRSNSNPVFSSALRRRLQQNSSNVVPAGARMMATTTTHKQTNAAGLNTTCSSSSVAVPLAQQKRFQASRQDGPSARERSSYQSFNDAQGEVQSLRMLDATDQARWLTQSASHVAVPQLTAEERQKNDRARILEVRAKYGELGPGEVPTKNMTAERRDQLAAQQDLDGLPWEVRWRRSLVPSPEEIISEVRDRFELQYADEIERNEKWFLHWKDRGYAMSPDRLIWPQGYTDHLDHYDEFGRRRVLPSDQKWSDSSWRHLSDVNYRDRLFLMDSVERKHFHESLSGKEAVMELESGIFKEHVEMEQGITAGVVDLSPDQEFEKIAGTTDPRQIAHVKTQIGAYHAETKHLMGKELPPEMIDPVTSYPKSSLPPLPSGLSVEEAAIIASKTYDDVEARLEQTAAQSQSLNAGIDVVRQQLSMGKKAGNKPIHGVFAEKMIEDIRIIKGETTRAEAHMLETEMSSGSSPQLPASSTTITDGRSAAAPKKAPISKMDRFASVENLSAADSDTMKMAKMLEMMEQGMSSKEALSAATKTETDDDATTTTAAAAATAAPPRSDHEGYMTDRANADDDAGKAAVEAMLFGRQQQHRPEVDAYGLPKHSHESAMPRDVSAAHAPEWYLKGAIFTDPLITEYGMTRDPIESRPVHAGGHGSTAFGDGGSGGAAGPNPFYERPKNRKRVTADEIGRQGVSTFDTAKIAAEQALPELQSEFKPLPLYREVPAEEQIRDGTAHPHMHSPAGLTPAQDNTIRKRRLLEERRKKMTLDQELLLPDLPWEGDMVHDPKKGVAEHDLHPFDRAEVEKTYRAYRAFFLQNMHEFIYVGRGQTAEAAEQFVANKIEKCRAGDVGGEKSKIHPMQEEVFKLLFEANLHRQLADLCEERSSHSIEADALKRKSDDVGKAAIAKAKVVGPSMVNFIHEIQAMETENNKKNPVSLRIAHAAHKCFNPVVKPFTDWYVNVFQDYIATKFEHQQQIQTHKESMEDTLSKARLAAEAAMPRTLALSSGKPNPREEKDFGVDTYKAVIDSFSNWSRGLLFHYTGMHYMNLMRRFSSTMFRSYAEKEYNEANDHFIAAFNTSGQGTLCILPTPDCTPLTHYEDTDFVSLEGEPIPILAERQGNLEVAERGWSAGSNFNWYPVVDESELMMYYERRGMITNAIAVSERCLDNLNKKTHPSVHPFPEKALKWLEGAPLTRETAEHLWMRYVGQRYLEHSAVHFRLMQFATARELRKKGMNFLYGAVEMADKSLPKSWRAPLVTKTLYLMKALESPEGAAAHIRDVEDVMDALYKIEGDERAAHEAMLGNTNNSAAGSSSSNALVSSSTNALSSTNINKKKQFISSTSHWVCNVKRQPLRIALLMNSQDAYKAFITEEANRLSPPISDAIWDRAIRLKVAGEDPKKHIKELAKWESILDDVLEEKYQRKVLKWREAEAKNSAAYHMLTFLCFTVKANNSSSSEETMKIWEKYRPTYEFIYGNVCLGLKHTGEDLLTKSIRIMFNILSAPTDEKASECKQLLLTELNTLRERIPSSVHKEELLRSIVSLEGNLKDPKKPLYCYMNIPLQEAIQEAMQTANNPDLVTKTAAGNVQLQSIKDRVAGLKHAQPH